jgi:fructose/tagatose bisphosphate aldolase
VKIDASHEPFEENVAITRRVMKKAHVKGISVETRVNDFGNLASLFLAICKVESSLSDLILPGKTSFSERTSAFLELRLAGCF